MMGEQITLVLVLIGLLASVFLMTFAIGHGLSVGWYRGKHKEERRRDALKEGDDETQ